MRQKSQRISAGSGRYSRSPQAENGQKRPLAIGIHKSEKDVLHYSYQLCRSFCRNTSNSADVALPQMSQIAEFEETSRDTLGRKCPSMSELRESTHSLQHRHTRGILPGPSTQQHLHPVLIEHLVEKISNKLLFYRGGRNL